MNQTAKKSETKTYSGKVERYISGPTADGFAIIALTMPNGSRISVKGRNVLSGFGAGDKLVIKGRETSHPRYGNQVQAFDVRVLEDPVDTPDGLTKWLAEAGIPGIGKARAQTISTQLGNEAVEKIIRGEPAARTLLGGMYDNVCEALKVKYGESKFGPRLTELGLGRQTRLKVYERFGADTGKMIDKEPYKLITEIEGISFATADKVARNAGLAHTCEKRIMAAACHVLRESENEGHTWLPIEDIIKQTAKLTEIEPMVVAHAFDAGPCPNAVKVTCPDETGKNITGWATTRLAMREEEIARVLIAKMQAPKRISEERAKALVEKHEALVGIELNAEQRKAAIMALVEPICVITGGPGRGKTTVLDIIARCWKELSYSIDLGSPTGKAAQRMRESTGIHAQTVHRMLGASEGKFQKNENNPLTSDVIAIDESSMLDIYLCNSFGRAWGKAQILFIGDADQIASVGPGRVFRDMVMADIVPTVRLIENRRQAEGSSIPVGAEAVCRGEVPKWENDLIFIECKENDQIAAEVERIFKKESTEGKKVQILTPGHASEAGTIDLNERLRIKNDDDANIARIAGGAPASVGDEVIQLENCDERRIANGDVGTIKNIVGTGNNRQIIVAMQTPEGVKDMVYKGSQTSELGLAWALTVHKAQGSEYDVVIVPMTTSHWKLLRRTLFNTAITRAKTRCYVIGQKRAVKQAVSFDDSNLRLSRLHNLLAQA